MTPETIREEIRGFLNSTRSKKRIAPWVCGATMEHVDTTFTYADESWEVKLPFCRNCHPEAARISEHEV